MTEDLKKDEIETKQRRDARRLLELKRESELLTRRLGAVSVIVIGIYKEGDQVTVQDSGKFPMPPDQFYEGMAQVHRSGAFDVAPVDKRTKKIILPN